MNKRILLKHIRGEASESERTSVIEWIDQSSENKEYYMILKNLWISHNLPEGEATDERVEEFIRIVKTRDNKTNKYQDNQLNIPLKRSYRIYRTVAAFSLIAASVAVFLLIIQPSRNEINRMVKEELITIAMDELPGELKQVIYTPKGVKSYVVLSDSTKVWINSDTKLTFPNRFIGSTREVEIEGEAFFSVKKDTLRPMVVRTNKGIDIKVLGTEFNVKCYNNDNITEAILFSGKINLTYNNKDNRRITESLQPNEKAIFQNNTLKIVNPKEMSDEASWKNGRLVFDATSLREVIKILERWHGVEFVVKEKKILDYSISATFKSESIIQIMNMIKYCSLVDYKADSTKITLFSR